MFTGIQLLPDQASTGAQRIDAVTLFLFLTTAAIALLVAVLVIFFSVKYRRRSAHDRPPKVAGSLALEVGWTSVTAILALVMFVWGARVYFYIVKPPENALEIYVVGKQWMWKIQHPEGQREINELHVPVGRPVRLTLTSEDVIHGFFVPAFRTKLDVIPGRYVHSWFQATRPGRYHLFCTQYCGTNHSGMTGTVVVQSPEDYERWLTEHAEGSLALEGRKIFLYHQCVSCHSGDALARAPLLEGIYLQPVRLTTGATVTADENYLRESILEPQAKIVAGYEPIMPTFQGVVTEDELIKLIAFLRSLQPGQSPPRVDDAPVPILSQEEKQRRDSGAAAANQRSPGKPEPDKAAKEQPAVKRPAEKPSRPLERPEDRSARPAPSSTERSSETSKQP